MGGLLPASVSSTAVTTVLLYFFTAAACAWLIHRFVRAISVGAASAMILLPLLFVGRALFTSGVYAPVDLPYLTDPLKSMKAANGIERIHNGLLSDVYCLNIPWKYAVRVAYEQGDWALWNPFSFAGDILAASAQSTPYEPIFLLSLLLPFANSLTFIAGITLFLTGLLAFAFFRELRCSELASLTGATAWMFSTFLVFWLEWVITPTTMWMPLILLAVRRIVRERTVSSAAILTAAFVMMLLNGHPESALHIVTVGLMWAAVELTLLRFTGIARAALLGIGAGVVALLLTAIYMLPIIEGIPQTAEHDHRQQVFALQERSVPTERAVERLKAHFVPFVFGAPQREWPADPPFLPYPESSSCGSVALALALFGAWKSEWRGKWMGVAMVVLGLTCAIELAPFADWIAKIPLYDIALNNRLTAVAALGIALLAALGVDALDARGAVSRLAAVAFVTAIALAMLVHHLWPAMQDAKLSYEFVRTSTAALIVPVLIASVFALLLRKRPVQLAVAVLVLIAAQRTIELSDFYPTLPASTAYPKIPMFDKLPKSDEPYRVTGYGYALIPNTATLYRLEDVRGYQAMTFAPMKDAQAYWSIQQPVWWNRIEDLQRPFISMLNVRYAIAEDAFPTPDGWREVARQPGSVIWENSRVLPRAFVPQNIAIAADPVATFGDRIFNVDDFGRWSWVEIPDAKPLVGSNGPGTVTTRRAGMNALELNATLENPSWIVISQMAWKGWRAYVDGNPTKVRRANHTVLGIYVDKGTHAIRLQYLPHSFVVGRAISLATIVALAMAVLLARRRRMAV